jgi:hypothetical protein
MNGFLDPNQTVFHNFTFKPKQLKMYNFDICCRLCSDIASRNSCIQIEVSGKSKEGSLIVNNLFIIHLFY